MLKTRLITNSASVTVYTTIVYIALSEYSVPEKIALTQVGPSSVIFTLSIAERVMRRQQEPVSKNHYKERNLPVHFSAAFIICRDVFIFCSYMNLIDREFLNYT